MKGIIYITGRVEKNATLLDVIRQYKSFENPESVEVYIHSEGGNVNEGESIYNYLKAIDASIPVYTYTNKAYSIAAKIFAAGRERTVEDVDKAIMVHFAWGKVEGNAEKLEAVAEALRELEGEFSEFYSGFLGVDAATISALLDNETFLSGSEAVDLGFATKIKVTAEAVAELNIENSKTIEMTQSKKAKGFFKTLLAEIQAYLKEEEGVEINAELTLQDSAGTEIVFPDLESGDTPKAGDKATIDGAPVPDGSYIMPSLEEATVVFVDGAIAEVKPKEMEDAEASKKGKKAKTEINAEEVQQISVWTMEVVNTSFAEGDTVKYIDWDGVEQTIGSGEFQLQDGRRVVTDATGVIVKIKEATETGGANIEEPVETEASFKDLKSKMAAKIKAELKAEFDASLKAKETEISNLKKKIGSKEFNAEQRETVTTKKQDENPQVNILLTRKKKN